MSLSEKKYNNKLSWRNRIKLCWAVLTTGEYNPENYRGAHEEEQWKICEKRRKEMDATTRPRTHPIFKGKNKATYTDYYDKDRW